MAWSIPTYAGVRATGSPSNYRLGMFELIRAVHEREIACGLDTVSVGPTGINQPTLWFKADGSTSATITMADLLGLPCTGSGNLAGANLIKIRNSILNLTSFFTESSGKSDVWTTGNLSTAIGYDLTQNPTKINDAAYWQAMQDALDLLLYPKGTFLGSTISFTGDYRYSDGQLSLSAAWADRANNSGASGHSAGFGIVDDGFISYTAGYGTGYTRVLPAIPGAAGIRFGAFPRDSSDFDGTITEAIISYSSGAADLGSPASGSVAGNSVTVNNGSSSGECNLTPWTLSTGSGYAVAMTIPSSLPFSNATLGAPRYADVGDGTLTLYLDITSELTDQA